MKRLAYSNWTKFVAFVVQEILVVLFILNALILFHSDYLDEGMDGINSYVESDSFVADYEQKVRYMQFFIDSKIDMEEDGRYNPDKVVFFSDFLDETLLTDEYSLTTGYRLGDLVEWSNQDIEFRVSSRGFGVTSEVIDELNFQNYSYDDGGELYLLEEPYMDVDGMTMEKFVCDKSAYDYLPQMYYNLSLLLSAVKEEYDFYVKNQDYGKSSNFYFYIENQNGDMIFTNEIFKGLTKKEILEKISKCNIYATADKKNRTYSYNRLDLGYGEMKIDFNTDENYVYSVGIDTRFMYKDDLQEKALMYEEMHRRFVSNVFIFVVGMLLFCYQAYVSGEDEKGKIKLTFFDEVKTGLAAFILLLLTVLTLAVGIELYYDFGETMIVITGLIITILFSIGVYSLSTRIKAHQLWKNSIICWLLHGIKKFFEYRDVTFVITFGFIVYLLVNGAIIFLLEQSQSNIFIVLLIVFNAFVGYYLVKDASCRKDIIDGIEKITSGDLEYQMDVDKMFGTSVKIAEGVNNIGDGLHNAVDASVRNERLKTDLITNVSHDIKTPLTSIINYVDLIKREDIQDEKIRGYIEILDSKSQRLKHLTEDLVEASKISSGNIKLEITQINFVELVNQTDGEFSEKMKSRNLEIIKNLPSTPVMINADGRRIWRVVENLYNNVAKYAMAGSRVYVDVLEKGDVMEFSIKNISEQPLNIQADELTERFIRGDVSRSTEGSGLGLSIAKNLTELQNGEFEIYLDGDLFRVTITFPKA